MIEKLRDTRGRKVVVNWEYVCFAHPSEDHDGLVWLHFDSKSLEVQSTIEWCFEQMGTACGFTQGESEA